MRVQAGKIVGGIVLLIIGIVIYSISSGIQPTVSNYQEQCQSFLGKLGQTLDSNTQQQCTNVNVGVSASFGGMILAVVWGLIGIIVAIVGAIRGGKNRKEQIAKNILTKGENNDNTFIFCRYCGKKRPINISLSIN